MNICIDIGNSGIKTGIFNISKELIWFQYSNDLNYDLLKKIIQDFEVFSGIVSSTREIDIRDFLLNIPNVSWTLLNEFCPVPIRNNYLSPDTLGKDRLAAAVGAFSLFPEDHILIIDVGTCITYDIVLKGGIYIGGNISPGWRMRLKAMHVFTEKLPMPQAEIHKNIIGRSTVEAMQNGAYWGTICELTSFIELMGTNYSQLKLLMTGGDAVFFSNNLNTNVTLRPNLVIEGLNEIKIYNAGK